MVRLNLRDRLKKAFYRLRTETYEEFFLEMKYDEDEDDPANMVGSPDQWEMHGDWQLDYAQELGLEPDDRLLDVGCGPLRFGLTAIDYLDEGNYVGFDISETAIQTAMDLLADHDLEDKRPTLFCNKGYDVYFNGDFQIVWAQSVLTHVPPEHVEAFFAMVANNLGSDGRAMVTFREADTIWESPKGTGYQYPIAWLQERLPDGLTIERVDREAGHPQGQDVLILGPGEHADAEEREPPATDRQEPPTQSSS